MKLKILAIIPARGGSKRLKNKNIKIFNKKPLIASTIEIAQKSKFINEIYLTSDDNKILKIGKRYKIKTIKRPKKFSNDTINVDVSLRHAYLKYKKKFDYIVTLQPTIPLRTIQDIDASINKIINDKADSLLTVFKRHSFFWEKSGRYYRPINYSFKKRPRSQDVEHYQENGAVYVTKPEILINSYNRLGGKISIYIMNFWKSFDIDDIEDFKYVEKLLKY
tara:strand:+ start:496 stop:1158 length:663 start_codon:yes stop_codon:yes gene_type:complete